MAKGLRDSLEKVLSNAVQEATKSLSSDGRGKSGGPLSGMRGIAAGAGAVALAPLAVKGVGKLARTIGADGLGGAISAPGKAAGGAASKLGQGVGSGIGGKVSEKVDEAGGPSEILKSALPLGGGDDDDDDDSFKDTVPGVGKGRRMPVQQSIDIAVPLETAYNQWTQFELWPNFMHRVTRVTQKDDCTLSFATKIWGKTKEFTADIETQRPDERIKWRVTDGITHTGVVTFHEIAPRLTRIELGLDVEPGGLLEKAARGLRHIKRAARADLHRFKAFIEMQEQETGAWRGVVEDGELVEEHDPSYDRDREYSDVEDIFPESEEQDSEEEASEEEGSEEEEAQAEEEKPRRRSSSGRSRGTTSRNGSSSDSGSSRRSSSSRSRSSSKSGSGSRWGSSRRSSGNHSDEQPSRSSRGRR